MTEQTGNETSGEYRVLARKYRPATFEELIGQGAMVRTLENAINTGRLAHAFILTGVRGVGKTTTARLIAKTLNCVGEDGQGDITATPCGKCDNCIAIAESRHVDIMEMDAASRTGVDDIREIIDSVRYAPVSARFKVYIIDEVHMLSKNAFNALLKTLEEPPPHVKFIFATTEIRKLPVTVLSRCQRFDLRRVDSETLIKHLSKVTAQEGVKIDDQALIMIARASEGSVRDGLSLLDQAIAHGGGDVSAEQVRDMLGLADRAKILDLIKAVMSGDAPQALSIFAEQFSLGADPAIILKDLAEVTHWLTRLRVTPDAGSDKLTSEAELSMGRDMAQGLQIPQLTRAWQILLKGMDEVRVAATPMEAAEMVLIRLCYAADLPSPAELVKKLEGAELAPPAAIATEPRTPNDTTPVEAPVSDASQSAPQSAPEDPSQPTMADTSSAQVLALQPNYEGSDIPDEPMPINFRGLVEMFERKKEAILALNLTDNVELVSFKPGVIELHDVGRIPPDLAARMRMCLQEWTATDWQVAIVRERGEATLKSQEDAATAARHKEAATDPLVQKTLEVFPGAKIISVNETKDTGA